MSSLLIGFDSAWTPNNCGALVGVLRSDMGSYQELGPPRIANYQQATEVIVQWQGEHQPTTTIVLLDQPTIVPNPKGQRPVENLVASPVSRRYGGVQPANTSKTKMFGKDAPVWQFLKTFGGATNPHGPITSTRVLETYPVLTMIALGWTLPDSALPTGRLPKYNPANKKTFSVEDWRHVCQKLKSKFETRGLLALSRILAEHAKKQSPLKADQDCVDSCICLLVAFYLAESRECLMVGNVDTGYIVVPHGNELRNELLTRCDKTNRPSQEWVRALALEL